MEGGHGFHASLPVVAGCHLLISPKGGSFNSPDLPPVFLTPREAYGKVLANGADALYPWPPEILSCHISPHLVFKLLLTFQVFFPLTFLAATLPPVL